MLGPIGDAFEVQHTVEVGVAPSPSPTPAPISASPFRNGNPRISPVGEKLNAEESTAIRAQLIREIETLPEVDLQPRDRHPEGQEPPVSG